MKRQLALAALLVCMSSRAWPQAGAPEATGSDLDPQCNKPQANLVKPSAWNNESAVYAYNAKIRKFNRDAAAYSTCMHTYIDKANDDVKRLQDKANADLKQVTDRANASMKAIEDTIRQAVADAKSVNATLDEETAKLKR